MKNAFLQLVQSKKFQLTIVAIVVWIGGKAGLGWSTEMVLPIVTLLATLVVTIGMQDLGKEAAALPPAEEE